MHRPGPSRFRPRRAAPTQSPSQRGTVRGGEGHRRLHYPHTHVGMAQEPTQDRKSSVLGSPVPGDAMSVHVRQGAAEEGVVTLKHSPGQDDGFLDIRGPTWARNRPKHTANGLSGLFRTVSQNSMACAAGPPTSCRGTGRGELPTSHLSRQHPPSQVRDARCGIRVLLPILKGERAAAFDLARWFRISTSPVTSSSSGRSCVPCP